MNGFDIGDMAVDVEGMLSRLKRLKPYAIVTVVTFFAIDLFVLQLRGDLLPSAPPPPFNRESLSSVAPAAEQYDVILERNIFNADGLIAGATLDGGAVDLTQAQPSSLALELVATIVHQDSTASVAVLRPRGDRSKLPSRSLIVKKGETRDELGRIVAIQRGRVYFLSKFGNRLEYLELPKDDLPPIMLGELGGFDDSITRESEHGFSLDKSTLLSHTENLANVLQEARAVPATAPNGRPDGYRLEFIKDGSVFEKLGLQPGDVLRRVNGQSIDSPAKAIELYNALRNEPTIQLDIERGGRSQTLSYSVR